MKKTDAKSEIFKQQTKGKKIYFPFVENEKVQAVLFSEPTGYNVSVVEDFREISSSENEEVSADLGFIKTACLVVEATKDVEVSVLTIK